VIFAAFPLAGANGAILAHTTRLPDRVVPKGTVLDRATLDELARAGFATVTAARLEPGDVAEDEAAARLADALAAPGIERTRTGTGRANLAAGQAGLFRADAAAIDALNRLHEGLTIGTLPDASPVSAGDLLVTVKIIPFAIPGEVLAQAEALARAARPLRLPPFRGLRAGLVVTTLPGLKESVVHGTIGATRKRVTALGGALLPPRRVPHEAASIQAALGALIDEGADLLLIAGASATVDRGDVAPAAIVAAGGAIDHFGMPVDPGNLMCLGHIGTIPAVVLPGCARSPTLNGIDLVLSRLFAGEPLGPKEIAGFGVGGLLKDFARRPAPRAGNASTLHPVAALVLAAGLSSRMAPRNKLLLANAAGQTMVGRVVDAALGSKATATLVVVGHQADQVQAALAGRPVTLVHAKAYDTGLAASLRAGIAALPEAVAAVVVCLGDMPLVGADTIDRVIDAYDPDEGRLIVVPTHRGKRGNPVLWDRRFFADILALTGDTGARALLLRHAEHVAEIALDSDAVLTDFDTPEAASRLA
jgi:molybdenum cofactor cytidylyltransferase